MNNVSVYAYHMNCGSFRRNMFAFLKSVLMLLLFLVSEATFAGNIGINFKLGRSRKTGLPVRSIYLDWDDYSTVPPIVPDETEFEEGRVEVITGAVTKVIFYDNSNRVETEYQLKPGKNVFTVTLYKLGKLYSETKWTSLDDGESKLERFGADHQLLHREVLKKWETATRCYERRTEGNVVREEEWLKHKNGKLLVRTCDGTGPNARWTIKDYHTEEGLSGWLRSEISSDGSWWVRERDPKSPFHEVLSELASLPGSHPVTNAFGRIVGFTGKARRTSNKISKEMVEFNGNLYLVEMKTTVVSEESGDGTSRELSREYQARMNGGKNFLLINESGCPAGAAFGDARNRRRAEWGACDRSSTYCLEPDGTLIVESFERLGEFKSKVTERYETDQAHPDGIPFKTIVNRSVKDLRGNTKREEKWLVLPDGERDLIYWRDIDRDVYGREIGTRASDGRTTESEWFDDRIVRRRDESGAEHHYKYDAIKRLVHSDEEWNDENFRYDLGSQVTNIYGSVLGRSFNWSYAYDDAGELIASDHGEGDKSTRTVSVGPDGARREIIISGSLTNVTERAVDGTVRQFANGALILTKVPNGTEETIYIGPDGVRSPRWRRVVHDDAGGRTLVTRPGFGGGEIVVTNNWGCCFLSEEPDEEREFKTDITYVKVHGYWWRESRSFWREKDGHETPVLTERTRVTGRRRDGAEERVSVDGKGNETTTLLFEDTKARTLTRIRQYPWSDTPERTEMTNDLVVLQVSSSGVTNRYIRDFAHQGRISEIVDGRGRVTRRGYDDRGRIISEMGPDGLEHHFAYDTRTGRSIESVTGTVVRAIDRDACGRLARIIRNEVTVDMRYDAFGDLVEIRTSRDGREVGNLALHRDPATGLVTSRVEDGLVTTTYGYLPDGKLHVVNGKEVVAASVAQTNGLEIVRDGFDRATGYKVDGERRVMVGYDRATGRLSEISVWGLPGEAKVIYVPGSDLVDQIVYPNGVTASYEYDVKDRLVAIDYRDGEGTSHRFVSKGESWWKTFAETPCDANMTNRIPIRDEKRVFWPIDDADNSKRVVWAEKDASGRMWWCACDADGSVVGRMDETGKWEDMK